MSAVPEWVGQLDVGEPAGETDRTQVREVVSVVLGAALADRVRAQVCRGASVDAAARRRLAERLLGQAAEAAGRGLVISNRPMLSAGELSAVVDDVVQDVYGLRRLQPLLDEQGISAIHVDGAARVFLRRASGERTPHEPLVGSDTELAELVRVLALRAGVENPQFDAESPKLRFTLADGIRVCAVIGFGQKVSVAFRRPRRVVPTLAGLRRAGTIGAGLQGWLRAAVRARHTILVTGGRESGMTTLLGALAGEIDPLERLVSVEDTPQLRLDQDPHAHPDVVVLSTRRPDPWRSAAGGRGEVVEWAGWLDPDWLILDDLGSDAITPWVEALTRGEVRSLAGMTAISPTSAVDRITSHLTHSVTSAEEAAVLVASTVDFVVHLAYSSTGLPVVSTVLEVIEADGPRVVTTEVWRPGPDRHATPGAPLRDTTLAGLVACGFDPDTVTPSGGGSDR